MPRGIYDRSKLSNTGHLGISLSKKRYRDRAGTSREEEIFSVYFRDETNVLRTRTFYIGLAGQITERRYKTILQQAIKFREIFHHEHKV